MSVTIHQGDARLKLAEIPDNSIDCVVTSPPYWGLRDYGVDGQIGLEPDWRDWLTAMEEVFGEVLRILNPEGTCWVNLGDKYSESGNYGGGHRKQEFIYRDRPGFTKARGIAGKNLCLLPQRFAIAMQDMGWFVRSEIVWHKPNAMPQSVKDRPTSAHEKIYLLTKSKRYFYDQDAVKTPLAESSLIRLAQNVGEQKGSDRAVLKGAPMKAVPPTGWDHGNGGHGPIHRDGRSKRNSFARGTKSEKPPGSTCTQHREDREDVSYDAAANLRDVWTIASKGYSGAHFATFPEEIPKRCILLGCPPEGAVLDPFAGSGTTLAVALRLGRQAVGIELNPEYVRLIQERLQKETLALPGAGV